MKSKSSTASDLKFDVPEIRIGLSAAKKEPRKEPMKQPIEPKRRKAVMPGAPDALSERRNPTPGGKNKRLPKRRKMA